MDTPTAEQALRREAIRRRLQGERPCDICRDLRRSDSWLLKWWTEYRHNPKTDFADRSRAPDSRPRRTSTAIAQAVITIRQTLEAGQTDETRYGLVGHRAIRCELERLGFQPLPSAATIQRILARHGLTHPRGAAADTAYYPELIAWAPNAIHATDIITRHLHGGQVVQNIQTFDHYTHAVHLTQHTDKRSTSIRAHLLETWADLGIPVMQQFDNESAFRGGQTHPRVIGQVVRLCLFVGVEVVFIPEYEARRNHWVEGFHSLWVQAFWSRHNFGSLVAVQDQEPIFLRWYHTRYRPPSLEGKTPSEMRRGFQPVRLTTRLRHRVPDRLPISRGRIHFLRKVDTQGRVSVLNETWRVGRQWNGSYVRGVVDTASQTLSFWHKSAETEPWKLVKTFSYHLTEPVHPLLPEFRRDHQRCLEQFPS